MDSDRGEAVVVARRAAAEARVEAALQCIQQARAVERKAAVLRGRGRLLLDREPDAHEARWMAGGL